MGKLLNKSFRLTIRNVNYARKQYYGHKKYCFRLTIRNVNKVFIKV